MAVFGPKFSPKIFAFGENYIYSRLFEQAPKSSRFEYTLMYPSEAIILSP